MRIARFEWDENNEEKSMSNTMLPATKRKRSSTIAPTLKKDLGEDIGPLGKPMGNYSADPPAGYDWQHLQA